MILSPTPLEEAAKAVEAAELAWKAANGGDKASCIDCPDEVKATAAITAYLAQAEKEGWVMVPAKPIGWFNPWNDYHGFQQVAEEFEGGDDVYPFYANQKAHDDLAAAQNGGALPAPPMGK